jgi:peptidoglycan/xylan/chitin deacetylase (PgdA/CDA1 family)
MKNGKYLILFYSFLVLFQIEIFTIPVSTDIRRGSINNKQISITFDGHEISEDTQMILSILRDNNIKTTIFLTGKFIQNFPDLTKEIVRDGHEVGNHTLTHPHLTDIIKTGKQNTLITVNKQFLLNELNTTAKLFKELTNTDMISLWRAPYGEENREILKWTYEIGYIHVGWTIDYKNKKSLDSTDWIIDKKTKKYLTADKIKLKILNFGNNNKLNGGIILFHLGTNRNIEDKANTKLDELIKELLKRGYKFVKISKLK